MNAGQGAVCRNCRQFNQAAWDRGHPSPCRLFGWSGNVHYSPVMSEDGRQCEDYRDRGRTVGAKNHGSGTESGERYHGRNAPDPENGGSAADSLVEAIEPADGGDLVGCRGTGGNQKQLPGTVAVGLGRNEGNVGQTVDPVETE